MDPLAQLKDIRPPEQISDFPFAIGWWIVALLLLAIIIIAVYKYIKHRRLSKAKKQGLSYIQQQANSVEQIVSGVKWLCMQYFPRQQVAALHGEQLHQFLLSKLPEKKQDKVDNNLAKHLSSHYSTPKREGESNSEEINQLKSTISFWINNALPPKGQSKENAQ